VKAAEEDIGRDFVWKGENWIHDGVELLLNGPPNIFEPFQAQFELRNRSVNFNETPA
jgi:hypothetical protein